MSKQNKTKWKDAILTGGNGNEALSGKKRGEYLSNIVSNVILFFIINLYPYWQPRTNGVVTDAWVYVLWAMDLAVILNVIGRIILIAYSPKWMQAFIEFTITAASVISAVVFFTIFPISFISIGLTWLDSLLKVLLIVGIAGGSIGTIVWISRFLNEITQFIRKS